MARSPRVDPFAYPPRAFHAAALLGGAGRVPLEDVFRVLPLLFSWLPVLAFHRLARRLLADDPAVFALVYEPGRDHRRRPRRVASAPSELPVARPVHDRAPTLKWR